MLTVAGEEGLNQGAQNFIISQVLYGSECAGQEDGIEVCFCKLDST